MVLFSHTTNHEARLTESHGTWENLILEIPNEQTLLLPIRFCPRVGGFSRPTTPVLDSTADISAPQKIEAHPRNQTALHFWWAICSRNRRSSIKKLGSILKITRARRLEITKRKFTQAATEMPDELRTRWQFRPVAGRLSSFSRKAITIWKESTVQPESSPP